MPKLVVIAKGKPREIEMGQELTIGRGYSNLLRLEGEEISRVHAIIYRRNHGFILRDLDSKNGVFLNGNKIVTAELDSGDRVQVGKYRMVFNPPLDFDVEEFAENRAGQTTQGSNGSGAGQGMDISDDDFSQSRLFSASTPAGSAAVAEEKTEPEILREEVILFTRQELEDRLRKTTGIAIDKAGDYQEKFFSALVWDKEIVGADTDYLGAVLRATVKAVAANRGVVVLRDPGSNALSPGAIIPVDSDVALNRVVLRSGFTEGKAILCPSTKDCGLFRDSATIAREKISTLISIPLGQRETLGLLYFDRQDEADGFNMAHMLVAARVARLLELHLADQLKKNSSAPSG